MGAVLGTGMGLASAIGRAFTEPVDNMYDQTSADQVFTPGGMDRGYNTFNKVGVENPYGTKEATQFTGMARYGGDQGDYDMGGEYELTDEEIEYILANGGEIEFLD